MRARVRAGRIEVPPLRPAERARLLDAARQLLALASAHVGRTLGEFEAACEQIDSDPTDYRRVKGLAKLVLDRCRFEPREDIDPPALRRAVFARAAQLRRSLPAGALFDPQAVLGAVAAELGTDAAALQVALFADLKDAHRFEAFEPIGAAALLDAYELAQQQAVLLRAVAVRVALRCPDAASYRRFFAQLKFRRLLYRLEHTPEGAYRLQIDGPFSLFQSVTKYGLQLALLLPALLESAAFELEADVRWQARREPVLFRIENPGPAASGAAPIRRADEVEQLQRDFEKLHTPWQVSAAEELLDLPGAGLCVPDLVFTHAQRGTRIYLEVMGYWSRPAVWRRVELVQAGLGQRILFAVSERLRVSEAALGAEWPSQLYVFKGVIHAAEIARRLDAMAKCAGS